MMLELMYIALCIVFVTDVSGFTDTWKGWLHSWLGVKVGRVRPFDCSLCLTFWTGTIVLIATGEWDMPMQAYVCGLAALTRPIAEAANWMLHEVFGGLMNVLRKITDKISEI